MVLIIPLGGEEGIDQRATPQFGQEKSPTVSSINPKYIY